MTQEDEIEYLSARVGALESVLNDIINFHQGKQLEWNDFVLSDQQFWLREIEGKRSSIKTQLSDMLSDLENKTCNTEISTKL